MKDVCRVCKLPAHPFPKKGSLLYLCTDHEQQAEKEGLYLWGWCVEYKGRLIRF